MHHITGQADTEDGRRIATRTWLPESEPRAILAFSHGIGEHCGRYDHVGKALASAGYALHMADLRGHGESPGPRGHVMSFGEYRADFAAIVESAWQAAPTAPYFIGGHSLGGLIALSAALDRPLGGLGVVVTGPGLGLAFEPPAWKVALARVLALVAPGARFSTGLEHEALSRKPAVVQAYESDPLVHGDITARGYVETMNAQRQAMANAGRLEMPLLVMHGSADRLTSVEASRTFVERAGSADKTLKIYDGFYHELFNEVGAEQVLGDLVAWLDAHV